MIDSLSSDESGPFTISCPRRPNGSTFSLGVARARLAFSTMIMVASTMAPIAIAMPERDMILAVSPIICIGINEISTAMGSPMRGMSAERKCPKKIMITSATAIISSTRVCLSVSMARKIRSERSYVTTNCTPSGREGVISAILALILLMADRVFCPGRIITIPPTVSPFPSHSKIPRRGAGPI